jgi:hypothetical protein
VRSSNWFRFSALIHRHEFESCVFTLAIKLQSIQQEAQKKSHCAAGSDVVAQGRVFQNVNGRGGGENGISENIFGR